MLCALCMLYVLCNREQKLQDALHLHEFKRESSELEEWISQERLTASSDNYGCDYEHVLVSNLKRKLLLPGFKTYEKTYKN